MATCIVTAIIIYVVLTILSIIFQVIFQIGGPAAGGVFIGLLILAGIAWMFGEVLGNKRNF